MVRPDCHQPALDLGGVQAQDVAPPLAQLGTAPPQPGLGRRCPTRSASLAGPEPADSEWWSLTRRRRQRIARKPTWSREIIAVLDVLSSARCAVHLPVF